MKEKKQSLRILFLEENKPFITQVETILRESLPEFELKTAKTEKEFLKFVIRFQPNVILSGYQLNKYSAIEAFQLLRHEHHQIPFIIVTDKLSARITNSLTKKGMENSLFKSDLSELPQAVLKASEENKLNSEKEKAVGLLYVERSRLQTIFNNTPAAIMNISFKGDFLEINPTGLEMLQVDDVNKLDRKKIFHFIHPDDSH